MSLVPNRYWAGRDLLTSGYNLRSRPTPQVKNPIYRGLIKNPDASKIIAALTVAPEVSIVDMLVNQRNNRVDTMSAEEFRTLKNKLPTHGEFQTMLKKILNKHTGKHRARHLSRIGFDPYDLNDKRQLLIQKQDKERLQSSIKAQKNVVFVKKDKETVEKSLHQYVQKMGLLDIPIKIIEIPGGEQPNVPEPNIPIPVLGPNIPIPVPGPNIPIPVPGPDIPIPDAPVPVVPAPIVLDITEQPSLWERTMDDPSSISTQFWPSKGQRPAIINDNDAEVLEDMLDITQTSENEDNDDSDDDDDMELLQNMLENSDDEYSSDG